MRRLSMGIGLSITSQVIATVQMFVLVPFFFHAWGADAYGRWLTLTALLSYLSLVDLGGQSYISNLLSMHHASRDGAGFRTTLSEGVSLFLLMGVTVLAVLSCALLSFRWLAVPGLGRPLQSDETWILSLLSIRFLLLALPAGIYVTVYRATGLFARGSVVGSLTLGSGLVVSAFLLYFAVSPVIYAAAMLVLGLLATGVVVWDTRRSIPDCRGVRIGFAEARCGIAHLGGAVYFWLMAVSQAVGQQGLLLVLALTMSPAVVAGYATHRTLASVAGYVAGVVQAPVWPELTFMWTMRHLAQLQRATFVATRAVTLLTGVMAVVVWLAAPLVYPLWTLKHLDIQVWLLVLLLVRAVLSAGWTTSVWALVAANHHRGLAIWSLVNVTLAIGLAVWVAPTYGVVGVAAAAVLADLLCGLTVFPVLAARFLDVPNVRVYAEIGWALGGVVALAAAGVLFGKLLQGWWAVGAFAVFGAGFAYLLLHLIYGDDRVRAGAQVLRAAVGESRTSS